MKRAAIYARFSSDRQNERSCHDQIDLCTAWAERQGIEVVATFDDSAISGASMVNRAGLAGLMRDARARRFDIVLAEALDRLSRDQADLAGIKKELAFLDIAIMTVQDGLVGAMHIGLKGLMGELYLADLSQKTHRGQSARVRAGGAGGGRSYGYQPAREAGEMSVIPAEADVVRRIFEEYAAGETPRAIVARLNAEHVPAPRGGKWNASTINGSRQRQNGILSNRLYVGEIVWNRQRFIKDPTTGKRISRLNPESEWITAQVPGLAIVAPDLFARVAAIKAGKGTAHASHARKPPYVFSGLVKCGSCGASYVGAGIGRLECSGRRERGDCSNHRSIRRAELEERVLGALATRLAEPRRIELYVATFIETQRVARAAGRRQSSDLERKLAATRRAIERLVDAIVEGTPAAAVRDRMTSLESERLALEAQLADIASDDKVVTLHPGAAERYRVLVEQLTAKSVEGRQGHFDEVRRLIDRIVISPTENKKPVEIEVYGAFAELLTISSGQAPKGGIVGCGSPQQAIPPIRFVA